MKYFVWSDDKNQRLKAERGVLFEDVMLSIEQGGLLDILEHHNPARYPGQRIMVVRIGDYAYLVPFVEAPEEVFLKTIIPSRKATRQYLRAER